MVRVPYSLMQDKCSSSTGCLLSLMDAADLGSFPARLTAASTSLLPHYTPKPTMGEIT